MVVISNNNNSVLHAETSTDLIMFLVALLGILWDSWSEAKTALTQWFGLRDCVYPLSNQHT